MSDSDIIVDVGDRIELDYLNSVSTIGYSRIRTIKTIKHHSNDLYIVSFEECKGEYSITMKALKRMVLLRYERRI